MRLAVGASLIALIGTLAPQAVLATPIITTPFNQHENVGANPLGVGTGERQNFGAVSISPANAGTTATATQGGPTFDLFRLPLTLFPELYSRSILCSPCPTGSWTISATDGSGVAVATTPPTPSPQLLPLVQNLHVVGDGLTPTIKWTLPDLTGFDVDRIRVRAWHDDVDVQGFNGATPVFTINDLFFQSALLPANATQFTVPLGVLEKHRPYIFEVFLEDFEVITGFGTFIENRSRTFTQTPFEVAEPASLLLLAAGVLGLGIVTKKRRGR